MGVGVMGYRIEYSTELNKKYPTNTTGQGRFPFRLIITCAVCATASALCYFYRHQLLTILLPGDPEITRAALSEFISDVKAGEGIGASITAFCEYIFSHG